MSYEFNDTDARIIKTVALRCKTQAILLALIGVANILNIIVNWEADKITIMILIMIQGLLFIGMGIFFYRPADNFENVDKTKGDDVGELMTGIRELSFGFLMLVTFIAIMIVIDIVVLVIR